MKITNGILQRLRELPIELVAGALGIEVKRHKALCFIHEDHHPSLAFSPKYNTWCCFACGEKGDVISLVEKKLNLNFVDACQWLAPFISPQGGELVDTPVRTRQCDDKEGEVVDEEVLQYVLEISKLTPQAAYFLYRERHYSPDAVIHTGIRAIRWGKDLADALVEKFGEDRALASGMVIKSKDQYYSYFHSPSLLFPYCSQDGKILAIQARYLGKKEQLPRFQFTRGQRVPIFNLPILNHVHEGTELYVSEGVTDCLALLSEGKNAIAIPSATLLKASDLRMLSKYRLVMYPDQDEPGERLFAQIQDGVAAYGGTIHRKILPQGIKDYSEYHKRYSPYSKPSFGSCLVREIRRRVRRHNRKKSK